MVLRSPDEASRTTRERDLFRALLRLAQLSDLRAFVEGALATAVQLTGADKGLPRVVRPAAGHPGAPVVDRARLGRRRS